MFEFVKVALFIYLIFGFIAGFTLIAMLRWSNEYEVMDLAKEARIDQDEARKTYKKLCKVYEEKPYTLFTLVTLVGLPTFIISLFKK